MKNLPCAIDLFCGAGGMSLGFERAGFDVVAAFDSNPICTQAYSQNFPETIVSTIDLSHTSGSKLLRLAGAEDRRIDVLFGGPPCQGFSLIGKRQVSDARNNMVLDFARLIRQVRPKYFVMENVRGLLSGNGRNVLRSFVRRVKRSGYRIVEPIGCLNASDFGIPQDRKRVFILGFDSDAIPPCYPTQLGGQSRRKSNKPTVEDAITDLPTIENYVELIENDLFVGKLGNATEYSRKLRLSPNRDCSLKQTRRPPRKGLGGCKRTMHVLETVQRFSLVEQGETDAISRCKRLSMSGLAPTLRAGTGPSRGSFTAARPIHPTTNRYITVREAARLHSIPDWFELHPTTWHGFMQVGNSVPPLLASAVAKEIMQVIDKG